MMALEEVAGLVLLAGGLGQVVDLTSQRLEALDRLRASPSDANTTSDEMTVAAFTLSALATGVTTLPRAESWLTTSEALSP